MSVAPASVALTCEAAVGPCDVGSPESVAPAFEVSPDPEGPPGSPVGPAPVPLDPSVWGVSSPNPV
jgi:hypothetical protein